MSDVAFHRTAEDARKGAGRTVFWLICLVMFMISLAFAAVPFYNWFCRVTGFGGTPLRVEDGAAPVVAASDSLVTVYFDASTSAGMPWDFAPTVEKMVVRVGEPQIMTYRAHNPTDRPIAGTSTFNVDPLQIGGYFVKIDCFCFQEQILQPGETVEMPVSFYVDPELVEDPEMQDLQTITLSYTFFRRDDLAAAQ